MVTLLLPVTRSWTMDAVIDALGESDIPRGRCILVLDAPGCEAWQGALASIGFTVEAHATGNNAPPDTTSPRPRRARQASMREFTIPLVPDGELLILDDDALVPPDVYARLTAAGRHACGVQVGRYGGDRCGVKRRGRSLVEGQGVEAIDQCGHYCLLTTGEVYRATAVAASGQGMMRPIAGLVCDWGCIVGHLTEGGVLYPRGHDTAPKVQRIPKIIYATWLGGPVPVKFRPYVDTWRRVMPDYDIRVLGLDDIPHNAWVDAALDAGKPILAAHFARFTAVYETGGIYLDLDVEVLRPFDDYLGDEMFVGVEGDRFVNCAIFGAVKGHPFLKAVLDALPTFTLAHPHVENETGPRLFTNLLKKRGWRPNNADATVGDVSIYGNKHFYPYLWNAKYDPKCITPETHAIHHWANTWGNQASIVIPCYNQAAYLAEAIESVLAQTLPALEIIVVDDGSPDDVAAVVARYPGVRLIRQDNSGVSAARNAGIRSAKGSHIATLDADDRLDPRYLERMLGVDDIVSASIETFGAERKKWAPPKSKPACGDFIVWNQMMCCSLYKREIWEQVGGYDEAMRDGYEDWDFWVRATHAGHTVTVLPDVLFHYRKHPVNRSSVPSSVDHAHSKGAEIQAYMRAKWERLGITREGVWVGESRRSRRTGRQRAPVSSSVTDTAVVSSVRMARAARRQRRTSTTQAIPATTET